MRDFPSSHITPMCQHRDSCPSCRGPHAKRQLHFLSHHRDEGVGSTGWGRKTGAGNPDPTEAGNVRHQDVTPVPMVPETCPHPAAVMGWGRSRQRQEGGRTEGEQRNDGGGGLEGQGRAEIPFKRPRMKGVQKQKQNKSKRTPAAPRFPVFLTNHQ